MKLLFVQILEILTINKQIGKIRNIKNIFTRMQSCQLQAKSSPRLQTWQLLQAKPSGEYFRQVSRKNENVCWIEFKKKSEPSEKASVWREESSLWLSPLSLPLLKCLDNFSLFQKSFSSAQIFSSASPKVSPPSRSQYWTMCEREAWAISWQVPIFTFTTYMCPCRHPIKRISRNVHKTNKQKSERCTNCLFKSS